MTFYHLFGERYKDIEKLRIMLFYNALPKKIMMIFCPKLWKVTFEEIILKIKYNFNSYLLLILIKKNKFSFWNNYQTWY